MDIKRTIISAVIVYILGVTAYSLSYFVHLMNDQELQANIVLTIALIPIVMLGVRFYYKKGAKTNGFKLGIVMFLIGMCLDALITVPVLIMPYGGDHISFFTDPGFWLIATEYILVVGLYSAFIFRSRARRQEI